MKKLIKLSYALLFLFIMSSVIAQKTFAEDVDYKIAFIKKEFLEAYEKQIEMLKAENPRQCLGNYNNLLSNPEINISVFYGYTNVYMGFALDYGIQKALTSVLQKPCTNSNVKTCDFKIINSDYYKTLLRKQLVLPDGINKTVNLTVYFSSLTVDSTDNNGIYNEKQKIQTKMIESSFQNEISHSNVLFYSGHSRHGGGPGFKDESPIKIAINSIFKSSLRNMTSTISQSANKPSYIGMFACESEKYYKANLKDSNPDGNLILANDAVDAKESEQALLGALNSILIFNCHNDFQESMRSATIQSINPMKLIEASEF